MVWSTKDVAVWSKKIDILPNMISDHNLLIWHIAKGRKQYNWRINEDLLSHQNNIVQLKK